MRVLITGANRGIGLEFARSYSEAGYEVLALCRKSSKELQSLSVEVIEGIDVSNDSDLLTMKNIVGPRVIDLLINNAGIMRRTSIENFEFKDIEKQFIVNSLAPLKVVNSLLSNFKSDSKIAFITSRMGSITDNSSGGSYGYRMSKAALNAAGKSLAYDLNPKGISVAILHPGWVKTDMTSHSGLITTKESVHGLVKIIDELNLQNSGTFWHTNGEILNW